MPIDAVARLDRLRAIKVAEESGAEPYLWAVLLWVEVHRRGDGQPDDYVAGVEAAPLGLFRAVMKPSMRPGEEAPVPSSQRVLAHRFPDGALGFATVLAALIDDNGTPDDSVRAGYQTFVREVDGLVAQLITNEDRLPSPAEEDRLADEVQRRASQAARDAASFFDKLKGLLGFLGRDNVIDRDSVSAIVLSPASQPFILRFAQTYRIEIRANPHDHRQPPPEPQIVELFDEFELDGRFEISLPPPPDTCRSQEEALQQARTTRSSIAAQIESLQAQLEEAGPQDKPRILRLIAAAQARLEEAEEAVAAAQQALDACRQGA